MEFGHPNGFGATVAIGFLPPAAPLYRPTPGCPSKPGNWTATGGTSLDPCYVLYSYLHGQIPYGPVRSVALFSAGVGEIVYSSGYVEPFGGAPYLSIDTQPDQALWSWDVARGIALCPNTYPGFGGYAYGGYEVDLYGGIHSLGYAPHVTSTNYFYQNSHDIARGIILLPNCVTGYVLDAYGKIHPFAADVVPAQEIPSTPTKTPSWSFDIARSFDYVGPIYGVDSGYVLDGYGGVSAWGNAPATSGETLWEPPAQKTTWDIARAIVADTANGIGAGYTLDGYGGVHPFGGEPSIASSTKYWGADVARGIAMIPGSGAGNYVDTSGSVQSFTNGQQHCC